MEYDCAVLQKVPTFQHCDYENCCWGIVGKYREGDRGEACYSLICEFKYENIFHTTVTNIKTDMFFLCRTKIPFQKGSICYLTLFSVSFCLIFSYNLGEDILRRIVIHIHCINYPSDFLAITKQLHTYVSTGA